MSIIITIFGLVFLAEFISWIGKSVLIEWVRLSNFERAVADTFV